MGMFNRLSLLVIGGSAGATEQLTVALQQSYLDCARRAAQLLRHAEMAPQSQSTEMLKRLAADEEEQRRRLQQAIEATGTPVPAVATERPAREALNHWARLVQDLEAHQAAVQRFRELVTHFTELSPKTAGLFDMLCREEAVHCEDLRALIARADPHALD
jgi:phage shock protein A